MMNSLLSAVESSSLCKRRSNNLINIFFYAIQKVMFIFLNILNRMKKILCLITVCSFCLSVVCQVNVDSVMVAKSEKLQIQQHKGLFGLSKPDFGSFTTLDVTRFDSAVTKKKTKDSSYFGFEISNEGTDIDLSKFMTIEKTKFYRLQLATNADTMEAVFSISSVSKEKRQTLLGKMLSKHDKGKDVFSYNRDVAGIIKTGIDSMQWKFLIENFTSGSRVTGGNSFAAASISDGYLKNDNDSLYMQIYSSFSADLILVNIKGEHIAALEFKQKPLHTWIRNDIGDAYRKAIAALFAVVISIKDL
jgi:hypothetical protein